VLLSLPAAAAGRVLLEYSLERRLLGLPVSNTPSPDENLLAPDAEGPISEPGAGAQPAEGDIAG